MGISKFIKSVCVETALYWAPSTKDGYGGHVFSAVQEINCRWDEESEVLTDDKGKEFVSHAKILLTEDAATQGWICHASLADFPSGTVFTNPKNIQGAFPIKKFVKAPMIKSTTEFVRTAYI